jgi:hypothetical protein
MDLDATYLRTAPSAQNAVDLFQGEWSSQLPPVPWPGHDSPTVPVTSGPTPLFADPRIDWAADRLAEWGLPVAGRRILELGPLEGGHTAMLCQKGAREVVAIEANKRSYLKCLVAKELYHLDRARFLLGESTEFLRRTDEVYDIGIASGILYHMANPVELLELLARRCRAVFVWTVFYDPAFYAKYPAKHATFSPPETATHAGYTHRVHRHHYGEALDWNGFCGGSQPFCHWLEQTDILGALAHFGLRRQICVTTENVHATALQLVAMREDVGS